MHRSFAVATAAIALTALGACGSDTTEGGSDVPDEADAPTTQASTPSEESPSPSTADTPDSTLDTTPDAADPTAPSDPPIESLPEPTDTIDSDTGDATTGDGPSTPERLGEFAATDLATRLGIDVGEIEVVAVDEVTWPDASLGCPQKDFQYAQVLTPGIRIELSAHGTTYAYHAGDGRDPFYCVDPQRPV